MITAMTKQRREVRETKGGEMKNLKIEQITIVIAYDSNQTETAFDSVIESVLEGEMYDNYKVLTYDNPVEYKLVKK